MAETDTPTPRTHPHLNWMICDTSECVRGLPRRSHVYEPEYCTPEARP